MEGKNKVSPVDIKRHLVNRLTRLVTNYIGLFKHLCHNENWFVVQNRNRTEMAVNIILIYPLWLYEGHITLQKKSYAHKCLTPTK